ncbi:MAG: hypothetical protein LV481_12720 [Methylacidiphilales bacterium]|nr:hypothetical protein [Candidatus Methylacidiphilales bacterium]
MSTSIYDTKMTLDDSGFLAAMEKAREAADKSISMMSAIGESIGGLGAKVAGLSAPGIGAFAGNIKGAMKQARQASPPVSTLEELRQVFQRSGVSGKDMGGRKTAPLDHFKTHDADRLAKLGLFIGGAPQTPGISEARRTATATEAMKKGIDKLVQGLPKIGLNTGGVAHFA